MSEWISVKDNAPNSDDTVLIKTKCGEIFTAVYWFNDYGREWVCAFSRRGISEHPNEYYEVAQWKPIN